MDNKRKQILYKQGVERAMPLNVKTLYLEAYATTYTKYRKPNLKIVQAKS